MKIGWLFLVSIIWTSFAPDAVAEFEPNDAYFNVFQWNLKRINTPLAWDTSTGSASITIAILDTGVITSAPDLAGRLLTGISAMGSPPFSDSTLQSSAVLRHGTHVASVLGMGIDNSIGGAGVGNFTILPITVTNSNGNNASSWIAEGIRVAADNGARVINISHSTLTYGQLDAAAAYARTKGALTFVAAGNNNNRQELGDYPNLIFVAGTDINDDRWTSASNVGSSWGPYIDLAAPAQNILVADPTLSSGYGLASGTSFAAPLAAGVAGLVWSINPLLSPSEVEHILFSSANDLGTPGWDEVYGHGRIDAGAATTLALATVPEPSTWIVASFALLGYARFRLWYCRQQGTLTPATHDIFEVS
jgi:thermitase